MTQKEKNLGIFFSKIAEELNITQTMLEKAINSYEAVGEWLGSGILYTVKIMPQGSINLGTVIKPISDLDDYDVDLVCLLENGYYLSLKEIKNIVGNRLKENKVYKDKLEPEGKRCWTMQYDEFHMDILPCVPKSIMEPNQTAIKLTHKNGYIYEERYSNPSEYHNWFEERMKNILLEEKEIYAKRNEVSIEEVPTYKIHTPLQQAIQLLKRHRDICFENNDDAPISIIITTLSALSYDGERNVYEALKNIIKKMPLFIKKEGNLFKIQNPVMPEENFADKWNSNPNKAKAFFNWLKQAQKDLIERPIQAKGIDDISKIFYETLGEAPVKRALKSIGKETHQARQNNKLYINGLSSGIALNNSINSINTSIPVKEHTFFGK